MTDDERVLTRRRAIALMGAAGLAAVAAACTTGSPGDPATAPGGVSCVLTPEQTEGPFYLPDEAIRRDITEGSPGVPIRLDLSVADATSCKPISNATVEVWHADAAGDYSGFGGGASSTTFLRGGQVTDAGGAVRFHTIYPGWYQGRAVHIHVKVHMGGSVVHTGQLYFDDAFTDRVYRRPPYDGRTGQRTLNTQDAIYANGGSESTLTTAPGGDGYVGAITMGVRTA